MEHEFLSCTKFGDLSHFDKCLCFEVTEHAYYEMSLYPIPTKISHINLMFHTFIRVMLLVKNNVVTVNYDFTEIIVKI